MAVDVEINDLGLIGSVADTPPYMLPPEAMSLALNMHIVDGGYERLNGWEQVFGAPGVAPHFTMAIRTASATFWLYTSLTNAVGYDGTTHTDVTRAGSPYAATATEQWNGTLLGGVPIINNGIDIPQFWSTISLATDLQNLTNWPATLRAKVVRAFGPFLLAIGITKSGTSHPHMLKWSHPADPGSVPSSWDETDATKDTGEKDLPDVNAGILVDMLQLGDTMYLYKETSTWKCRYVGGRVIFDIGFGAWLPTSGILAARCVAATGDGTKHVVATQDDIIWHNGNRVQSVLTGRQRKRLFQEIDTQNFHTSFMLDVPSNNEMWFCYPSSGASYPNRALIMHYGAGEVWPITEADGITFRGGSVGPIEGAEDEDWEANENEWEVDDGPWSELERRRVIVVGTDATKFYNLDKGSTRDGVAFTGTLQRLGLSVLGRKRNGEWIVDFKKFKLFDELWPKMEGGPVNIRLGAQEVVDGSVTWMPSVGFNPAAEVKTEAGPISGRAGAIEFSAAASFRLDGYKLPVTDLGMFG